MTIKIAYKTIIEVSATAFNFVAIKQKSSGSKLYLLTV
jgi:hypothetical protein